MTTVFGNLSVNFCVTLGRLVHLVCHSVYLLNPYISKKCTVCSVIAGTLFMQAKNNRALCHVYQDNVKEVMFTCTLASVCLHATDCVLSGNLCDGAADSLISSCLAAANIA